MQKGVPFRDAYRRVAGMLDDLGEIDPHAALAPRTHMGTSGDLGLDESAAAIAARRARVDARVAELAQIAEELLSGTRAGLPGASS